MIFDVLTQNHPSTQEYCCAIYIFDNEFIDVAEVLDNPQLVSRLQELGIDPQILENTPLLLASSQSTSVVFGETYNFQGQAWFKMD